MSYVSLAQKLKTTLTPLKTAKKVKHLEAYEVDKLEGFPIICIVADADDEDFDSTASNRVTYRFKIFIHEDLASKTKTKEQVEMKLLGLADDALNLLRSANYEDAGFYLPISRSGGAKYLKRTGGNVRTFEINFEAQKKASR